MISIESGRMSAIERVIGIPPAQSSLPQRSLGGEKGTFPWFIVT